MANNRYVMFEKQDFTTETFGAFGSAAAAHAIDQVSEDISFEHGFNMPVTSAKRAARNRLLGAIVGGGDVGVPMYSRGFPTLAYYALGKNVSVQGTPTTSYVHTITPGNTIPAFRMGIGKDLNEHQFVGCAMKSMKLDYTIDNQALATFDVLTRKELTPNTIQTPTFPDYDEAERSFLGTEVIAEFDDTPVAYVRSFSVEINNTLVEDNHGFGSRYIPELVVQDLEVKGNMTLSFTDIARYNEVHNEDRPKVALKFTHDTVDTSPHREVTITLPQISLDVGKLPTDGNKEYIMNIDFTAEAVNNDDELIIMKVINEENSAAQTA